MLTILAKILKALNSGAKPWQIGWAMALGMLAGILPFGLLTILVLLIACMITINLSTFLLLWGMSSAAMLLIGESLEALTWRHAQSSTILEILSSNEILQVLHLHHSLMLGSFTFGLLLLWPVAWLGTKGVELYRERVRDKVMKLKVVQLLKASKLSQLYYQLN